MKRNLLLFFTLVTAMLFLTTQTANAQACDGVTIDPISAPDIAPTDADGNNTACANGLEDAAYAQEGLPGASLPNVSYIIEFSNESPVEINETGMWNSVDKGLQPGDMVGVRAFTYDLDSINGSLNVAVSLCPTLDALFPDLMPCGEINSLAEGDPDNGDEPGLQTLGEALDLATALTGVVILSTDSAIAVLETLNETIMPLGLAVCFNYTEGYSVLITECEANPDDLDGDGISNADEDINGDGDLANDDTDGDGVPNAQDSDDDGDTIPTADELGLDTDDDGIPNFLDDNDNNDEFLTVEQVGQDADSDGIEDHVDLDIVGIYEQYILIAVYPNPTTTGVFTVDINQFNNIEIFNHIGQSVGFNQNGREISINQADKGLYFVKIYTQNETYITKLSIE